MVGLEGAVHLAAVTRISRPAGAAVLHAAAIVGHEPTTPIKAFPEELIVTRRRVDVDAAFAVCTHFEHAAFAALIRTATAVRHLAAFVLSSSGVTFKFSAVRLTEIRLVAIAVYSIAGLVDHARSRLDVDGKGSGIARNIIR